MIAILDVDYRADHAIAACVLLRDWGDEAPHDTLVARVDDVQAYEPGAFYKRELPCLEAVIAKVTVAITCAVVDGYVWLDGAGRPGLGARVYERYQAAFPVVGVAKTRFGDGSFATAVIRGASAKALWVTAAGMDAAEAAAKVRGMHGPHRIPTALSRVDRLCREA